MQTPRGAAGAAAGASGGDGERAELARPAAWRRDFTTDFVVDIVVFARNDENLAGPRGKISHCALCSQNIIFARPSERTRVTRE